jgi:hypothetical protein
LNRPSKPGDSNPWAAPAAPLRETDNRAERGSRGLAWLFSGPKQPVSAIRVFAWWELRRLPFNLIVGTYSVVCLVIFFVAIITSGHLQPWEDPVEPIALMAAPFVINVLYTLGWIVELIARSLEPGLSPRFGPTLLKLGIGLGLFLSTVPAAFWTGYRMLQWTGVLL